jgi:hypothetical protein
MRAYTVTEGGGTSYATRCPCGHDVPQDTFEDARTAAKAHTLEHLLPSA